MDKTQKEKIRERLEANFLDGDKINDCGGATFSVDGALSVAEYFFDLAIKETEERMVKRISEAPSVCGKCDKYGVNTYGECKCSYEDSGYMRKKDFINLIRNK